MIYTPVLASTVKNRDLAMLLYLLTVISISKPQYALTVYLAKIAYKKTRFPSLIKQSHDSLYLYAI
jgi:uncharacterized membrane protein YebE (DUF533 family)